MEIIKVERISNCAAFPEKNICFSKGSFYFVQDNATVLFEAVVEVGIHKNHLSAQASVFDLSIPVFIYSSVLLSILICGQRAMSLCGPDNLGQFPLQFISHPITHLVKQHQAPQGRGIHLSKPLSNNHIWCVFFPQLKA